ncbi:HNH endonuclease [Streptomyces sp. HU2014]|uniref:HNH endonuclease n=1 Tax=Streptomyces sp. HU2014 TaxID=2939414 RepID=UPI00200E9EEC|nr:HNH endonuclease signature motif containing protein [Streptomyces sp. HU2014]UQI48461.1 HNH endonuclease [Streptomyces sp. HU2014]
MSHSRIDSVRRREIKRRKFSRDGRCFYCRTPFATPAQATLDHYIPHSLWRTRWAMNLVLACWDCNQAKADVLPWPLVWLLLGPVCAPVMAVDA